MVWYNAAVILLKEIAARSVSKFDSVTWKKTGISDSFQADTLLVFWPLSALHEKNTHIESEHNLNKQA